MNTILKRSTSFAVLFAVFATVMGTVASVAHAELPKFADISKDYTKITVADHQASQGLFNVWKREKDAQLLAELPKSFANKRYFIALTVSSGDRFAGLQAGDWIVKWRRYDDRLALIAPNLTIRATGDDESKASVKRLFTDRVLLDVPIVAMGPGGGPVVDMDAMLVGNASLFFGPSVRITNPRIRSLESAKVFPKNVEIAFEVVGRSGRLQSLHYSFSEVPSTSGFKPRKADERVGYFTTTFSDLSKYTDDETRVRYINRWRLEKRDDDLKLSPPKEPVRFYVEHTTPVRYRRWIKAGVDYWNKAFEKVGLVDAIVIEYQDAQSGVHMEKDPEDVRYNFIRWLNNDIGTAIGPSRVHPETGEILDADIILTDGWIRHFNFNYEDLMPRLAMESFPPETLAWLGDHPNWDPRLRMVRMEQTTHLRTKFSRQAQGPMAGFAMAQADSALIGDDEFDGLYGLVSQKNGLCMAAAGRSLDLALARMDWGLALMADEEADKEKEEDEEKEDEKEDSADGEPESDDPDEDEEEEEDDAKDSEKDGKKKKKTAAKKSDEHLLDGMPEWFVGPLLADLVAHEVGHTLGLRHNFKASSLRTLAEINSPEIKGKKTMASSVMDYTPINYRFESGEIQGDYAMIDIGPYDYWAIEYGYTFKKKNLPEILKRCTEPELQYATDEDTTGPDPLARRYDFTKDPLDYATEQMKLVKVYREKLLDRFVKDGDSWAKARRGYELTLGFQTRAGSMMANWVGGAFINRDKKGDPGDRPPVEVVPAEQQRAALNFVIKTTFHDEAFGLTPELLERMSVDKWLDGGNFHSSMSDEATWPIHDRILGLQSAALTWLMNPTTLRRLFDNELRLTTDQDVLTLPEVLDTINASVWSELDAECPEKRQNRKPMISSLRRNLQREHLQRLIDLVLDDNQRSAVAKPVSNLSRMQLRSLSKRIESSLDKCGKNMDAYSAAHLTDCKERIDRALEASYTYNAGKGKQPNIIMMMLGKDQESSP